MNLPLPLRDRLRSSERRTLRQPSPRLARHAAAAAPSGYDQPHTPARSECELSLLHLLDLRRRYRDEAERMRVDLRDLQHELESSSRELWHHLARGQGAPSDLRTRCDDLVAAVEIAERDLADVHLAIEGIGQEVMTMVAARQRA